MAHRRGHARHRRPGRCIEECCMNARLQSGGRIDRTRVLRFTFNGRSYQGHPGDTLASALLANGVSLVAR
ncbi:MAG TPA: 2Fe-2S iron-sulfur cluster-binding protein, partial [Chloroflexota bacterium]|nr:2Fe-2S iron-sulfur cluster-binding protein [Chloroflexota bacterium]